MGPPPGPLVPHGTSLSLRAGRYLAALGVVRNELTSRQLADPSPPTSSCRSSYRNDGDGGAAAAAAATPSTQKSSDIKLQPINIRPCLSLVSHCIALLRFPSPNSTIVQATRTGQRQQTPPVSSLSSYPHHLFLSFPLVSTRPSLLVFFAFARKVHAASPPTHLTLQHRHPLVVHLPAIPAAI